MSACKQGNASPAALVCVVFVAAPRKEMECVPCRKCSALRYKAQFFNSGTLLIPMSDTRLSLGYILERKVR